MKKYAVVFLLVVVATLMLGSLALWAYPASIRCPIDGEYMFFDHKVGYGPDSVCWYTHNHTVYDREGAHTEKHDAYVPCPD